MGVHDRQQKNEKSNIYSGDEKEPDILINTNILAAFFHQIGSPRRVLKNSGFEKFKTVLGCAN